MAIWPWYGQLALGEQYVGESFNSAEFLQVTDYKNLQRWAHMIRERPAVKRGRMVNRTAGDLAEQLHERHDASDFETNTQDKIGSPEEQPA
jgi:GST-like protein